MSKTKKFLVSLLSLCLLIPAKSTSYGLKEPTSIAKIQTSNGKESNFNISKILFGALACFLGLNLGPDIRRELNYKEDIYDLSQDFSKRYAGKLTDCKITQRQEGQMWCWLACLQGLLKYHGINKSQKEILKGISYFTPIANLECDRKTGLSIYSSKINMANIEHCKYDYSFNGESTIFPNMIKDYVEQISNRKLTYQMAYIKPHSGEDNIKKSIYDIYNKIGRKPFSMLANHTSVGHLINVHHINNKGIMYIEDPAFGKGRKESINKYVKHFDTNVRNTVDSANGIMVGFVVEKDNELQNPWFWSCNYKLADSIY